MGPRGLIQVLTGALWPLQGEQLDQDQVGTKTGKSSLSRLVWAALPVIFPAALQPLTLPSIGVGPLPRRGATKGPSCI